MQIEYVAVKHSKKSHGGFYKLLIGFIAGLFFMESFHMMIKAEEKPIAVIYTDDYIAKHPELAITAVGIAPDSVVKEPMKEEEVFSYSEEVPLSPAVQEYIWAKCKEATSNYKEYYYFMLGAIELESSFRTKAVNYNSNGTVDRGLCQINSVNVKGMKQLGIINTADDLFDTYKNINCAFQIMNEYIWRFGICESAYYAYNTGKIKEGSNKNSRAVMKNMAKWREILS